MRFKIFYYTGELKIVCVFLFFYYFISVFGDGIPAPTSSSKIYQIDPNGYILFCLCMGRFGNQIEHFLGGLAFAKELNRTLILPPFRTYKNVPFDEWFKPDTFENYHRTIPAEDFMQELAPRIWPPDARFGFCYAPTDAQKCEVKSGNPFANFWNELNVDFVEIITHDFTYQSPNLWRLKFPPEKYPVLALKGAPAPFPMAENHLHLQQYLHFSDRVLDEAQSLKDKFLHGTHEYVAVHLRNGEDWLKACELADQVPRLMASYQCIGFDGQMKLNREMCYPSHDTVVQLIKTVVKKENVQYLLIATDKDPMLKMLEIALPGVQVVHIDPWLPLMDIVLMTDSKHFIGNCVSSFSSFVWRHRHFHDKGPTSFLVSPAHSASLQG